MDCTNCDGTGQVQIWVTQGNLSRSFKEDCTFCDWGDSRSGYDHYNQCLADDWEKDRPNMDEREGL